MPPIGSCFTRPGTRSARWCGGIGLPFGGLDGPAHLEPAAGVLSAPARLGSRWRSFRGRQQWIKSKHPQHHTRDKPYLVHHRFMSERLRDQFLAGFPSPPKRRRSRNGRGVSPLPNPNDSDFPGRAFELAGDPQRPRLSLVVRSLSPRYRVGLPLLVSRTAQRIANASTPPHVRLRPRHGSHQSSAALTVRIPVASPPLQSANSTASYVIPAIGVHASDIQARNGIMNKPHQRTRIVPPNLPQSVLQQTCLLAPIGHIRVPRSASD